MLSRRSILKASLIASAIMVSPALAESAPAYDRDRRASRGQPDRRQVPERPPDFSTRATDSITAPRSSPFTMS